MRARAGVRAARKPGTAERDTDWHLRRCGQLQSACQYSHGIHVSISVGSYSVREAHGESNQRDERVHNRQFETVVEIECLFGVLIPIVVVAMLSRCRGAKLHVRRGCWRLAYAVSRAESGARGCGRGRGTRGSGGGAGVRVRSACACPASRHGGLPREPNESGCERERGHASALGRLGPRTVGAY